MTAKIALSGKYAVGAHAFALVDDADFAYLNQWRWKAKWNAAGNHVYAVRNVGTATLRMHRVVLNLDASCLSDVDHINHDALDNRRCNLRVVTRSVNIKNAKRVYSSFECSDCRKELFYVRTNHARTLCDQCARAKQAEFNATQASGRPAMILISDCMHCGEAFVHRLSTGKFCSSRCRLTALAATRRGGKSRHPSLLTGSRVTCE